MFSSLLLTAAIFSGQLSKDEIKQATVKTSFAVYEFKIEKDKVQKYCYQHYGSGTIIDVKDNHFYVLSCSHNLKHNDIYHTQIFIHQGDNVYSANCIKFDRVSDLSLLKVNAKINIKPVEMYKKELYIPGTEVFKSGYPNGENHLFKTGKNVEAISEGNMFFVTIDFASIGGESGGGIYRVSDRRFVGVLFGTIIDRNLTLGTRMNEITTFLDKAYND